MTIEFLLPCVGTFGFQYRHTFRTRPMFLIILHRLPQTLPMVRSRASLARYIDVIFVTPPTKHVLVWLKCNEIKISMSYVKKHLMFFFVSSKTII